jgi:hypothetical protein
MLGRIPDGVRTAGINEVTIAAICSLVLIGGFTVFGGAGKLLV